MKTVFLIISGKVINGLFGLLLFHVIKDSLIRTEYIAFSNCLAMLTLIATFSGGALSGLMLKRGVNSLENFSIVFYWLLFFGAISFVVVEIAISSHGFPAAYRAQAYLYLFTNLIASVVLIDFQLHQKFILMVLVDFLRIVSPIIALFIFARDDSSHIDVGQVLWFLITGNLYGTLYFFIRIRCWSGDLKSWSYIRKNWKSDLLYSFWFSLFNAFVQLMVAVDRKLISESYQAAVASRIAYTADQVTRIVNGVIFPINTKISSELGLFVKENKINKFNDELTKGIILSLVFGFALIGLMYVVYLILEFYALTAGIELGYGIGYALSTTLYLASIMMQKRFDYTKLKSIPTVLFLLSFLWGLWMVGYLASSQLSIYSYTLTMYFFLILSVNLALKEKLTMDR